MDWEAIKMEASAFAKKYRLVLLVLFAGICLLLIPEQEEEPLQTAAAEQQTREQALQEILSRIKGAGKVEVLLSEYRGEEVVYQLDQQQSADSVREDTVIVSGADREEQGLVRQTNPPTYLGAVIVCQGGDIPTVKLAVVEAVKTATGLSSDKITVLKMK